MLSDLASVLAEMVDTDMGIRDVLSDAGVNSVQVALQGSPFQMWRSALEAADSENALPALLSVMRGRYPQSTKLFDAELRYWTAQQVKPQVQASTHLQKDMAHVQSTLAGLNVRLMYIERAGQERSDLLESIVIDRSQDWARVVVAIAFAAIVSSFLTVLFQTVIQASQ